MIKTITQIIKITPIFGMLLQCALVHAIAEPPKAPIAKNPFEKELSSPSALYSFMKDGIHLYFKDRPDPDWKQSDLDMTQEERKTQQELFSYDLAIEYIEDPREACTHPTLYLHGWQDTKNSGKILKKYAKVIPGDMALFNFADARPSLPMIPHFDKTTFAQIPDVLSALYTLNYVVKKKNLEAIDLFGVSRGAATIINMIAILYSDKLYETYKDELKRIGVEDQERSQLLQIIQNGSIVLDTPLRSMKHTLVPERLLTTITSYDPNGLDAFTLLDYLKGIKLHILVHFQFADFLASNYKEGSFYRRIAEKNTGSTYLVMDKDGGHVHMHTALHTTIDTFKKAKSTNEAIKENPLFHRVNNTEDVIPNNRLITFANPDDIDTCIKKYHQAHTIQSIYTFTWYATIVGALAIIITR